MEDLWPVQAERAAVLTSTPLFEHLVISATGRMALMRTIDPTVFARSKRWMADNAKRRHDAKRRRDVLEAEIAEALLNEGLLLTQVVATARKPEPARGAELVSKQEPSDSVGSVTP